MAIHLEEADPTLFFEEGRGNYSEKVENTNDSSQAHGLAMSKIKNSKREGLFIVFYWHTAQSSTRRHVLIPEFWSHEGRDEAKGQCSWILNHWRNGFMHGRESKLRAFPWTLLGLSSDRRSRTAVWLQHHSPGEDPAFLTDRAAESEATRYQKNLTCHLASIFSNKNSSFLLENQFSLILIDVLALSAHISVILPRGLKEPY